MKKIYKLLSILVVAAILSSCSVTKNTGKFHQKDVKNVQIQTLPVRADMEFDESAKITGKGTAFYFLFFKLTGDNHYADFKGTMAFAKSSKVKSAAQYNALKNSGADFIAKPGYTITKRSWLLGLFSQIDANVSGYKGVYKNLRQYDPLDRDVENLTNKKLVERLNLNK